MVKRCALRICTLICIPKAVSGPLSRTINRFDIELTHFHLFTTHGVSSPFAFQVCYILYKSHNDSSQGRC